MRSAATSIWRLVLPGRMFKESFEDMRLRPENLSRCLEDAGTITSNFFAWNTCGATMRKFLGVDSSYHAVCDPELAESDRIGHSTVTQALR